MIDDEPAGAMERSLPSSAYLTDDAHRIDIDRIFAREWVCAGREEDVAQPGDHILVDLTGQSIIVVRTKAGDIRAHYNVCRHRGARLCDPETDARWDVALNGGVIGQVIRCPYHGWSYGLDGALLAAPNLGAIAD
ncbi:Rieske (2Fe-2S) protein, partial [Sphingopyxis sp.]|uniref:aromatic ring-hydroxylating oxygenase subunit alpha n=1 Tax=Sphingopyxis sp. TaxID=1908224 RepID=UPI002EDBA52B